MTADRKSLPQTQVAVADGDQFRRIFEATPAATAVFDERDGRIYFCNEAYARVFGRGREAMLGKSGLALGMWRHLADRERAFAMVRRDGRLTDYPVEMVRGDGRVFRCLLSWSRIEIEATPSILAQVVDLSALEQAQAALRESEARFQSVFRSNPAAIIVLRRADRTLLMANQAAERMFGAVAAEHLGRDPGDAFWVDPQEREAAWRAALPLGRLVGLRVRMRRAGGEEFPGLLSFEAAESAGEPVIIISILDVSAEARARAAQRVSEERFAGALRSSPIGMTVTRVSDGRFLEANAAVEALLQYSRAELFAGTTLTRGVWPGAAEREHYLARLRAEGTVHGYETRMRRRDGEMIDTLIFAATVDVEGEACVVSSIVNITAQKRDAALIADIARGVSAVTGESFFSLLAEQLAHATGAQWVMVGEVVDAGRRVRTLVRLVDGRPAPQVEYTLDGSPCAVVLAGGEVRAWPDGIARLFPGDRALAVAGMRSYAGAPLQDADGRRVGIVNMVSRQPQADANRAAAVLRIFAARAQAELIRLQREREILALNQSLDARVEERTRQLAAANAEMESFSYSVSHDMRAPLRQIEGFLRILAEEAGARLTGADHELLARVFAATARMNELIEGMLVLAQIGRAELHPEALDLSAMAAEVVAELRSGAPERDVVVEIGAGIAARGDRRLLRVVLDNLLGNAWKFTAGKAGARIAFRAGRDAAGAPVYSVGDDGAGFDAAFRDKLFEPFQRLHGAQEFEGTGIGLATVKRIIDKHGGRIEADGRPGQGATFRFWLGPFGGADSAGST